MINSEGALILLKNLVGFAKFGGVCLNIVDFAVKAANWSMNC